LRGTKNGESMMAAFDVIQFYHNITEVAKGFLQLGKTKFTADGKIRFTEDKITKTLN
jgi:hypothetical protein